MSDRDRPNLLAILEAIEHIQRYTSALRERHSDVPWAEIKGFRNMIAHDYLGTDAEEVWQIIHDHVPGLKSQVERIVAEMEQT